MKTNRSLIVLILLNLITLGIYGLFFWHSYIEDVNTICAGDGKNTRGILMVILLTILTLGIYAFIWQYSMQNRLRDNAARYNAGVISGGGSVVLWTIFGPLLFGVGGIIATYIQVSSINRMAYAYNSRYNR